jgi:5-methylcytosine-specific restriction endonuclease McrA
MSKLSRRHYDRRHASMRKVALERDGYVCRWCGAPATEADHVEALAVGGDASLENLVASCKRCNARRGAKLGNRLRAPAPHPYFQS